MKSEQRPPNLPLGQYVEDQHRDRRYTYLRMCGPATSQFCFYRFSCFYFYSFIKAARRMSVRSHVSALSFIFFIFNDWTNPVQARAAATQQKYRRGLTGPTCRLNLQNSLKHFAHPPAKFFWDQKVQNCALCSVTDFRLQSPLTPSCFETDQHRKSKTSIPSGNDWSSVWLRHWYRGEVKIMRNLT